MPDARANTSWQSRTPLPAHMVVCTLCSCYPWPGTGLAAGLVQVGTLPLQGGEGSARRRCGISDFELPDGTEIRSEDLDAEIRYLVLPMRPAGTEGWSEERLADLVTRDSMIGTGLAETAA